MSSVPALTHLSLSLIQCHRIMSSVSCTDISLSLSLIQGQGIMSSVPALTHLSISLIQGQGIMSSVPALDTSLSLFDSRTGYYE